MKICPKFRYFRVHFSFSQKFLLHMTPVSKHNYLREFRLARISQQMKGRHLKHFQSLSKTRAYQSLEGPSCHCFPVHIVIRDFSS